MLNRVTFSRFLAASAVVCFHYAKGVPILDTWPFSALLRDGPGMVIYFFGLSGFVLTLAYFRATEFGATAFWQARFARIYPLYLLSIAALALAAWRAPVIPLVLDATLTQAFAPGYTMLFHGVAWTLSVEAFLYALFPLLLGFARKSSTARFLAAAVLLWLRRSCTCTLCSPCFPASNRSSSAT